MARFALVAWSTASPVSTKFRRVPDMNDREAIKVMVEPRSWLPSYGCFCLFLRGSFCDRYNRSIPLIVFLNC